MQGHADSENKCNELDMSVSRPVPRWFSDKKKMQGMVRSFDVCRSVRKGHQQPRKGLSRYVLAARLEISRSGTVQGRTQPSTQ